MPKSRIEAFSDCVIAFAITLLVLDIRLEDVGPNIDNSGMIHALLALAPRFSVYVISFLIYTIANGVISGRNGAALRLGLPRTTLMYRMQKLGIVQKRIVAGDKQTVRSENLIRGASC